MNVRREACELEGRLIMAGHSMRQALEIARVDRITWWRWKMGKAVPRVDSWERLKETVEAMTAAPALEIPPSPSEKAAAS